MGTKQGNYVGIFTALLDRKVGKFRTSLERRAGDPVHARIWSQHDGENRARYSSLLITPASAAAAVITVASWVSVKASMRHWSQ